MSRLRFWLALVALALPLLGAAETPYPPPVVVVYPITAAGGTNADAGSQIALLLSTRLAQLGDLTVKPFTPGTTRSDFLSAALKESADYYITGYLTPVGGDVSFIAQVVSTHSGSIIYSSTQLVHTYGDAAGAAEPLRDAMLHHAGRGLASLEAAPPQPTVSPTPSAAGDGGINITRAFGRHKGARPTSVPTVAAAPGSPVLPPGTTALVVATAGSGADADRTYATNALSSVIERSGQRSSVVALDAADVVKRSSDVCRVNPSVTTFYAPALAVDRNRRGQSVAYDLTVYDCSAAPIGRQRVTLPVGASGVHDAIERAAAEAVAGLHLPANFTNGSPSATSASPPATK